MNVYYIKIIKLLSSTLGVKGKFFNIKISLVWYNFVLILFLNFDQHWRGKVYYIVFS
jgi:peptidoglycan biosynthesis protein MviN/MurJ (putative lipid II flippase)